MSQKINATTETKIVALIARGDAYSSIQAQLKTEGVEIGIPAISKIKQRNAEALSYIKGELVKLEISKAGAILEKSRDLIEKKLNEDEDHPISIKDLTSVSKEFFNQSQVEAGKPTSITSSPEQAKKNLQTLLNAINGGNEEDIVKAIFLDA